MNDKFRERLEKLKKLTSEGANPYIEGSRRHAPVPALSAYWPTQTLTPTPTPTPQTTGPTSTPSPTPSGTATPTPTINFKYDAYVTGPVESEEYLIAFPLEGEGAVNDTLWLNNDYTIINQPHVMEIWLNGNYRTTIDYDAGRTGTQFGYSRKQAADQGFIEIVKTFTNGQVNINL